MKLSRLGLACDRPSITMLCATMASLIMDPQGVTLHQHPPALARYAAVMTWVELVKAYFVAEKQALEAWIEAWTQDPDVVAWAEPQIAADRFLHSFGEVEALWRLTYGLVLSYVVGDWTDVPLG